MSGDPASGLMSADAGPSPAGCVQFEVGGVSLRFTGHRLIQRDWNPALEQFRVAAGVSDISIHIDWVTSLVPNAGPRVFDSGTTWRLYENKDDFQFDFTSPAFGEQPYKRLTIDRGFRNAILHMNEESFARFPSQSSPLEYPLDELLIMHRLTQEKAIELHGCGIVRPNGEANLFVGHSGAGKSTTTRLWTEREDVEVLSDDRIIVRRDEGGSEVGMSRGDASSTNGEEILRLSACSASRISQPTLDDKRQTKGGMRMYGTPWHGEAMYASPNSAPLSRIFILEHGHGNVLTRLSPSQAVAELFARSFVPFHRHEYVDAALDFLQELVGSVPCYRYSFEPDQRAVDTIRNFQD
jgi:hypothetical protein